MPNWGSVLKEISTAQQYGHEAVDKIRRKYLKLLNKHTDRNVIAYYSGFLSKRVEGTEITDADKNAFMLCIHGMDRSKGLDLIIHTPGGDTQATVSLVQYLRSMFGGDLRAIVPQIAMSAGTMIACSCREIVMGKQSSLGPVDPQFGFIAAANMLAEVKRAKDEITANPSLAMFWSPILSQITPSFLEKCEWAVRDSNEFLSKTLCENMFAALPPDQQALQVGRVTQTLGNNDGRAHNTHLEYEHCRSIGLNVTQLEEDQKFQDLVLTIHHCFMHTFGITPAYKIVENHYGKAMVNMAQNMGSPVGIPHGLSFGPMVPVPVSPPELNAPEMPVESAIKP